MNFNDMKNMMSMMENMQGKSPLDVLSANNPQMARMAEMRKSYSNPAEMLSKMGISGFGNGMDVSQMMNMMGNIRNNSTQNSSTQNKMYYGLSPIASFATAEIVYELNRYLASNSGN